MAEGRIRPVASLLTILLILVAVHPLPLRAVGEEREATLTIVAVSEGPEGPKGVATTLHVKVAMPGSGRVYVSADPLAEVDLQASIRTAALVSSMLLHVNPKTFDVYVSIESESLMVGGPSAGAAITVAITSLLLGLKPDPLVVITGMVNPDGTIGPVGGLVEKLEAAAEAGAKYFLIPIGQRIAYRERVVREQKGPVLVERVEREKVDLVEYGSKLGVIVAEVATIRDALRYFTGYELARVEVDKPPALSPAASSTIDEWIEELLDGYMAGRNDTLRLRVNAPKSVVDVANRFLAEADRHAKAAKELRATHPYTAASEAFQAAYNAWTAKWILEASLAEDLKDYIMLRIEETNTTIKLVSDEIDRIISGGFGLVDALVAAKVRLKLARDAVSEAIKYLESGRYADAIYRLAYAKWRARTAQTWAQASSLSHEPLPTPQTLREISTVFYYEAESVTGYAETVLSEIGYKPSTLADALEYTASAKEALEEGDYLASLAYSLEAIAYSTISIHSAFTVAPEKLVNAIREETIRAIMEVKELGDEPLLSLSYLETAEKYMKSSNLENALVFYELAASHAKLLILVDVIVGKAQTVTPITATQPQTTTSTVGGWGNASSPTTPTAPAEGMLRSYGLELLTVAAIILTLGAVIALIRRPREDYY